MVVNENDLDSREIKDLIRVRAHIYIYIYIHTNTYTEYHDVFRPFKSF